MNDTKICLLVEGKVAYEYTGIVPKVGDIIRAEEVTKEGRSPTRLFTVGLSAYEWMIMDHKFHKVFINVTEDM